jgi:hypothetical protein
MAQHATEDHLRTAVHLCCGMHAGNVGRVSSFNMPKQPMLLPPLQISRLADQMRCMLLMELPNDPLI